MCKGPNSDLVLNAHLGQLESDGGALSFTATSLTQSLNKGQ